MVSEIFKGPFGKQVRTIIVLISLILFSLLWGQGLQAEGPPKELPMLVTIHDLLNEPDRYDGHRVVVTGLVRSIELQRGRRGSEYVMLVLEEESSGAPEPINSIKVISPTVPKVGKGHRALVQGVYHREGKQGGRFYEFFIDAEVILKEKPSF